MNYEEAKELLGNRASKKLANNTYLYKNNDRYEVDLHGSPIIMFYPNGDIVLDTCGWNTHTTRERINRFLPKDYNIYTIKGTLYLFDYNQGTEYIFIDGITITKRGAIKGAGKEKDKQKLTKLRKNALQYCKDYMEALCNNKIPAPSGGDCWYCYFKTQHGNTLGEDTKNDHIVEHVKDKYYVPSLFLRATQKYPLSMVAADALYALWCGDNYSQDRAEYTQSIRENIPSNTFSNENWHLSILKRQGLSSLKRYVYSQLNLAR